MGTIAIADSMQVQGIRDRDIGTGSQGTSSQ